MSNRPERYYQSSGAASLNGVLMMLLGGAALMLPGSLLYAWAQASVTQLRIKIGLALLFALAVGGATRLLGRVGNVRQQGLAAMASLILAGLTIYLSWMWFLFILGGWNRQDLAPDPVDLFRRIQALALNGLWRNQQQLIAPSMLTLWWASEALMVTGAILWGATQNSDPFCETCGRWMGESATILRSDARPGLLMRQLENEDYSDFLRLNPPPPGALRALEIQLFSCPDCDERHFLSIAAVGLKPGKERTVRDRLPFVTHLSVPSAVAHWITSQVEDVEETQAIAASESSEAAEA